MSKSSSPTSFPPRSGSRKGGRPLQGESRAGSPSDVWERSSDVREPRFGAADALAAAGPGRGARQAKTTGEGLRGAPTSRWSYETLRPRSRRFVRIDSKRESATASTHRTGYVVRRWRTETRSSRGRTSTSTWPPTPTTGRWGSRSSAPQRCGSSSAASPRRVSSSSARRRPTRRWWLVHHGLFWEKESRRIGVVMRERLRALFDADLTSSLTISPSTRTRRSGTTRSSATSSASSARAGSPTATASVAAFPTRSRSTRSPSGCRSGSGGCRSSFPTGRSWSSACRVLGGAARYVAEASAEGYDCFVTGEADEPTKHAAKEGGVHFIAGGHYATETLGVRALAARIGERFDVALGLRRPTQSRLGSSGRRSRTLEHSPTTRCPVAGRTRSGARSRGRSIPSTSGTSRSRAPDDQRRAADPVEVERGSSRMSARGLLHVRVLGLRVEEAVHRLGERAPVGSRRPSPEDGGAEVGPARDRAPCACGPAAGRSGRSPRARAWRAGLSRRSRRMRGAREVTASAARPPRGATTPPIE